MLFSDVTIVFTDAILPCFGIINKTVLHPVFKVDLQFAFKYCLDVFFYTLIYSLKV